MNVHIIKQFPKKCAYSVCEAGEENFQKPKKTVKPRNCNQKMDVDYCNRTNFSAFWDETVDDEFLCAPCDANQCFHRR